MGYYIPCECGGRAYISDNDNRGACERCRSIKRGIPKMKGIQPKERFKYKTKPMKREVATNQIRIKEFRKKPLESKLKNAFEQLKSTYPKVAMPDETFDSFVKKVFPPKLSQECVIKNQSYRNEEKGHVIRRAAIYNLKSGYLSKRIAKDHYIVFYGRPKDGEFIVDDVKVIQEPKKSQDDYVGNYEFSESFMIKS